LAYYFDALGHPFLVNTSGLSPSFAFSRAPWRLCVEFRLISVSRAVNFVESTRTKNVLAMKAKLQSAGLKKELNDEATAQ